MGVASSGKSLVGRALAEHFGVPFIEGDDLHGSANVEKMRHGTPLTDEDRWPWLSRVGAELLKAASEAGGAVASCSALKRAYRDRLREAVGPGLRFLFLEGDKTLLGRRMGQRERHFMPVSLLESQLATLESPLTEPDVVAVGIDGTKEEVLARALDAFGAG